MVAFSCIVSFVSVVSFVSFISFVSYVNMAVWRDSEEVSMKLAVGKRTCPLTMPKKNPRTYVMFVLNELS